MSSRIIFVNRFFYPDDCATSQILSDLAFWLAKCGEDVHVIASRRLYKSGTVDLASSESCHGVYIHRIGSTGFGEYGLLGRALDCLAFFVGAGWRLARLARERDIVVAKTDPPLLCVLTGLLARWRRFETVNWIQDLYPEIAARLGLVSVTGAFGRFLLKLRNMALLRATMNVAIGSEMAERLMGLGIPPERIGVIHNWTDEEAISPEQPSELRRQWGLEDKFVVCYSGNLGRAHDVETILDAADLLCGYPDIVFLFIGGGAGLAPVEAAVRSGRRNNCVFVPHQPRHMLSSSLRVADVHWLSLKHGFDGLVLPSKFYGIAAAGRPIVVVGNGECEFARLVRAFDCGVAVELFHGRELAAALLQLAEDTRRRCEMGANARRMLERRFKRSEALRQWRTLLRPLVGKYPALEAHLP